MDTSFARKLNIDKISFTLKFGYNQNRAEFPANVSCDSLIDQLYRTAEQWIRDTGNMTNETHIVGNYRMHLYFHNTTSTELQMVPCNQMKNIEQDSLIEIILVQIENNRSPHLLHNFKSARSTTCARCCQLILGSCQRCGHCTKTFHKNCSTFLPSECTGMTSRQRLTSRNTLEIDHPYKENSQASLLKTAAVQPPVPLPLPAPNSPRKLSTIIAKGVFPACKRGKTIFKRYAFYLTKEQLIISVNLSPIHDTQLPTITESDIVLPLFYIIDIKLTHFDRSHDDVFEIYCQNGFVLSIGKKSDRSEVQMEAAQFYSWTLDQWQSLINAMPSTPTEPDVTFRFPNQTADAGKPLSRRHSWYRLVNSSEQDQNKDLFQLYSITGEKIGEGQFGHVVGAYRQSNKEPVAIKVIQKNNCDQREIQRINGEINTLYQFNHMNILRLEAYFEFDDSVYLVTERLDTDMCQYIIKSPNGRLVEQMCRVLVYQVILALRYLHSNRYGHLDIKCENILLRYLKPNPNNSVTFNHDQTNPTTDYLLVKLADFGYSTIIGENSFRKTRVGTRVYNAPEIYRSQNGYNRSVDMWSLGIVLYAALSGKLPYTEEDVPLAEQFVTNKDYLFGDPLWTTVSREAKDLISSKLLVVKPSSRLRPNDALFDAWFTDFSLFQSLKEIERRLPQAVPSNWLTSEREDDVWTAYGDKYEQCQC